MTGDQALQERSHRRVPQQYIQGLAQSLGAITISLRAAGFRLINGVGKIRQLPIGSIVVPFWGLPYTILYMNTEKELLFGASR